MAVRKEPPGEGMRWLRSQGAKKGWQTRHARQRMLMEAQEVADARLSAHLQGIQNQCVQNRAQAQQSNVAQDYANAQQAQNNYLTTEHMAQRFVSNLSPEAQREYAESRKPLPAGQLYQRDEQPAARTKRLAKLKAWWRWFYHGE